MPGKSDFELRVNIALENARDEIALDNAITGRDGFVETYILRLADFGAAATDTFIAGVVGYRGKVINVAIYDITETFQDNLIAARIDVGSTSVDSPASDINYYYTGGNITDNQAANAGEHPLGTFHRYIPAATGFNITKNLATDSGTVAGISTVSVTIAWMALES